MDINNENNQDFYNIFDNTYDIDSMSNEEDIYSINRYNNRMYDNNRRNDYDRRYDNRYYQYPYCDRNGRCGNPIWWLFWPFFFF